MPPVIITRPTIEPITVAELKEHLRVETVDEDTLISGILTAVREQVEDLTRRALLTQTWECYLEQFPSRNYIALPFGNLQSVAFVKCKDCYGIESTLTVDTDYIVEKNGDNHGRIVLPYERTWPSNVLFPSKPITIRFTCGWVTRDDVPVKIKQAIKLLCAEQYENRGESVIGQTVVLNKAAENLIWSERLWGEF
jgi:uncharacterized phiE125 gp8 family phage protein